MRALELPFVDHLVCTLCGTRYAVAEAEYHCPLCGVTGILDVIFDLEKVKDHGFSLETLAASPSPNIWRYAPLLPIPDGARLPTLQVGLSPVYRAERLAADFGVRELFIKDDGRLPSASFKDRASAIGATLAVHLGSDAVAAASTGNAASSLACMSANLGIPAIIFVPARAPSGKLAQLGIFGATVLVVEDTYDVAWDLCQTVTQELGYYNRNCAVNPYLVEGKKTCGLEIAEQAAHGLMPVPDWVTMSVGDGCSVAGVHKGLAQMHALGIIDRVPRILAVQSEGADPLARAFHAGTETFEASDTDTFADSIAVGTPRNPVKALRAVKQSGGTFVTVSDDGIRDAMARLGRSTGVFGEPAGVAALAGLRVAVEDGTIGATDTVLHVVTGNGLKDVEGALSAAPAPTRVKPSLEAVRAALGA